MPVHETPHRIGDIDTRTSNGCYESLISPDREADNTNMAAPTTITQAASKTHTLSEVFYLQDIIRSSLLRIYQDPILSLRPLV